MRKIIAIILAVGLTSCQQTSSLEGALTEADSLYAIGKRSLDSYPSMRSILYFQRALDVLQNNDSASLHRKTRIFAEMGRLYAQQQLYTEAINRYQLSLTSAEQTNDTLGLMIAYKGLGDAYQRQDNTHEAIRHYNIVEQLATQQHDEKMLTSIAFHKAEAYTNVGKMEQAMKELPQPPYQIEEADEDVFHFVMAHILDWQKQTEKADEHYASLLETGSAYYQQYVINKKLQKAIQLRDFHQSNNLFNQKKAIELNREMEAQYEATGTIGTVYQVLNTEKEKAHLQMKNQQIRFYAIIGILSLVLVIAIIVTLLYRARSEQMRLARNQALLEKYNEALKADLEKERAKATTPQPKADIKTMTIRESAIYQRLLISEKPMNEADTTIMMELIDSLYPDLKTRLTTFGVIKEHELRMCYLIKMGFKTSRIATLLSRTDSAISNGRMRLYKKVFGQPGKGEDWDKVMLSL